MNMDEYIDKRFNGDDKKRVNESDTEGEESNEGDKESEHEYDETVFEAIDRFQPDVIFVAAGFDAMKNDGYANQKLSAEWYGWCCQELMKRYGKSSKDDIKSSSTENASDIDALNESFSNMNISGNSSTSQSSIYSKKPIPILFNSEGGYNVRNVRNAVACILDALNGDAVYRNGLETE